MKIHLEILMIYGILGIVAFAGFPIQYTPSIFGTLSAKVAGMGGVSFGSCVMCEVWKDIPDYVGKYQASTFGRIRSLSRSCPSRWTRPRHVPGKILSQCVGSHGGYALVTLSNKMCRVARLIALSFIPNPESKPHINHIDANKLNNKVENLEWCTPKENHRHAEHLGLIAYPIGTKHLQAKFTAIDVRAIRKRLADGESCASIGRDYNSHLHNIWNIKANKTYQDVPLE